MTAQRASLQAGPASVVAPELAGANSEAPTLRVVDVDGRAVVTDADGRTVYGNTEDTADNFFCTGTCTKTWVPVAIEDGLVSSRLDATRVGVVSHPSGIDQVTYGGIALYTRAADDAVGSLDGRAAGGVWFPLTDTGEFIR